MRFRFKLPSFRTRIKGATDLPPPIGGVPTSIAACVGPTTSGPIEMPTQVASMAEYEQTFGAPDADDTGVSARLFFENGGRSAYVVRTDDPEAGLQALEAVDLFNLLSVPGTAGLGETDAAQVPPPPRPCASGVAPSTSSIPRAGSPPPTSEPGVPACRRARTRPSTSPASRWTTRRTGSATCPRRGRSRG